MDKNGNITISNFQQGIADSPLLGFAKLANLEVFEKQGIAKIQFATTLKFTPASLPVAIVRDVYGNEYVGCEGGHFYVNNVLKNSSQAIYDMKIIADPSPAVAYVSSPIYHFNTSPGLNDMITGGTFSGTSAITYTVTIATAGSPDTFNWTDSNGGSGSGVSISGASQTLSNGVTITFTATTGHTTTNYWIFNAVPASPTSNTSYLLISRQTDVAIWGPLNSGGASLFSGWNGGKTSPVFASGYAKPIIVGQDNIVYIGNGNSVASFSLGDINIGSKFHAQADGTPPTLDNSISSNAFTLSQGHYVRCMAELGKWLMVGSQGGANFYDSVNIKQARIFPWDRSSTTFNLPVILKENGINSMLQLGNQLYINAGSRGRVYVTDSTNYQQIKRIPFTPNRQFGTTLFQYPNSFEHHNGELLCGVSYGSDAYPSKSLMGVYSMFLTPVEIGNSQIQYPIVMRNSPSSGGTGATQALKIGAVYSTSNDQLYIGWQDGSTYGVDILAYPVYTNFTAFIESQFYTVGSVLNKRTFKTMEISLTNPLITGQQIRISYRANLNDAWTIIRDINGNKNYFDSTNFGANNTFISPANLASLIKLQIKIELTQPSNTAFGNNIELEYVSFSGGKE